MHRDERAPRRTTLPAALAAGLILAFGLPAAGAELTLNRVMLSSVGMGYFEFSAAVKGREELSLSVPLDQVDDVLKSVVIWDSRGGTGTVRMPGREPLQQVFRDLPFGREALNSPAAILNALQGAEIKAKGTTAIQGRLFRAVPETVRLPDRQGTTVRHRVSVMTAQGLKQFILEDAVSVSFTSPELQLQVNTALAAVAAHRAQDRRKLRIDVTGGGNGVVTVGYVISVPLWKSAYRVTLPDRSSKAPGRFRGWAIVDNMSGQDWKDVELTLVSGSPVTFRQALYAAYFVDRPDVPVEVMGRVLPRLDQGVIESAEEEEAAPTRDQRGRRMKREALRARKPLAKGFMSRSMALGAAQAPEPTADIAPQEAPAPPAPLTARASATQGATQVVFRLPRKVTAAGGQSLMVPIIDRALAMERIALYQPSTHPIHPLASVRLANSDKTGLPPGVLTLYEQEKGALRYVGDARLGVLPAGEKRMVSFALDLRTRLDREVKHKQRIAKGKISRGVLELTMLDRQTTTYRVKAPAREDRRIMIEHPRMPGWTLAGALAKSAEKTPTHYRIARRFKAGSEGKIEVTLERTRLEKVRLLGLSHSAIASYVKTGELSQKVRNAFSRMSELRRAIDVTERKVKELESERKRIVGDQDRIRRNMGRVSSKSDLRRRYMAKLDAQETEIERLDERTDAAKNAVRKAKDALSKYVTSLNI